MSRYGSNSWMSQLAERRAIRDYYRKKFFQDHGFDKVSRDPFSSKLDPTKQMTSTLGLFDKAHAGIEGNGVALDLAKTSLSTLGLGLHSEFITPVSHMKFEELSVSSLVQNHFGLREQN